MKPENIVTAAKLSLSAGCWSGRLGIACALFCLGCLQSARAVSPSSPILEVAATNDTARLNFFVRNLTAADVTATIELLTADHHSAGEAPVTLSLRANGTFSFSLAAPPGASNSDYGFRYFANFGNPAAVHDDTHIYNLPYAPGSSYRVSQGYHGRLSHSGSEEYAIDWDMPAGTPVLAARDGLVVRSKDDEARGGPDPALLDHANCILIQHTDGTIGIYGHLLQGGNQVKPGDRVKAGDVIALSGSTGYTTGPHLHFAVFRPRNGRERESLPVRFQTTADNPVFLANGRRYKAPTIDHWPADPADALAAPVPVP